MSSNTTAPSVNTLLDGYIDDANAAGARAAEFLLVRTRGVRVEARGGRIYDIQQKTAATVKGRVYLPDGRCAPVSLKDEKRGAVGAVIEAAVARAAKAAPDPFAAPADRYTISTRGKGIDDVRYAGIDLETREEVALFNEETCAGVEGVIPLGVIYEDCARVRSFASSRGVNVDARDTTYSVRAKARRGRFHLETYSAARNFANVGSLPFGVDLGRRLAALGDDRSLPADPVPLVLSSRVLSWILQRIGPAFSAALTEGGLTFLSGKLGQRVGSHKVHLVDDAGLHGGLMTRAFDDRGVPPMAMPVIREGVLAGLYYGPEAARAKEMRPTGHDWEGALRPSNLILLSGNRSRTQMLSEVPVSVFFDHIDGEVDLATGTIDVSGPVFVLEKGRRVGAVASARLKTDVITLLSGIQELASDQERFNAVDCATALVVGVPVTAS